MGIVPLRVPNCSLRRGQWNDAYVLAAAIEKDYPGFPQQYDADYLLGRCWTMQADFEAARRAYDRVIHLRSGAKTETAAKRNGGSARRSSSKRTIKPPIRNI